MLTFNVRPQQPMEFEVAFLWLIRQHQPITYEQLHEVAQRPGKDAPDGIQEFGRYYEAHANLPTIMNIAKQRLLALINNGVLIAEGLADSVYDPFTDETSLSLAPNVQQLLSALNLSLSNYAARGGYRHITFPIFGMPKSTYDVADIFVIMPFRDHLQHIFEDVIAVAAQDVGVSCKRGDQHDSTNAIMDEVWTSIAASKLCIADCTGMNANVFYEIGIAHTVGCKTILITQSEADIPFDIRHLRHIKYEDTPDGLNALRNTLKETIKSELNL